MALFIMVEVEGWERGEQKPGEIVAVGAYGSCPAGTVWTLPLIRRWICHMQRGGLAAVL